MKDDFYPQVREKVLSTIVRKTLFLSRENQRTLFAVFIAKNVIHAVIREGGIVAITTNFCIYGKNTLPSRIV